MQGKSHPTWVRGLKFVSKLQSNVFKVSHPTWVRGLKSSFLLHCPLARRSHPTWVRGLKYPKRPIILITFLVAPHVGAWIEIW